ncbi:MAG: hypothetical protein K0S74_1232 [Chlamydiales bacterium]|jgi:hypothetical protein|nr:hypothetical protein [Chlamydiales bacterium]
MLNPVSPIDHRSLEFTNIEEEIEKSPMNPQISNISRDFLREQKIIPSAEEAKYQFYALGENWWKQIIDGNCHNFGKMVFDEGLHGRGKEPGYWRGIEDACNVLNQNFNQPLSLELYAKVHSAACQHFDGKNNNTICRYSQVEQFRIESGRCVLKLYSQDFKSLNKLRIEATKNMNKLWELLQRSTVEDPNNRSEQKCEDDHQITQIRDWFLEQFGNGYVDRNNEQICDILGDKVEGIREQLHNLCTEQSNKLNNVFEIVKSRLNLDKAFAYSIARESNDLSINYTGANDKQEVTTQLIFEFNAHLGALQKDINSKIQKLLSDDLDVSKEITQLKEQYQEKVISLIARLYAELEWLHPWIDGQGRTDLIILNWLLAREGVHPCILEEPYFSTVSTLEDWIDYLKEGLIRYKLLLSSSN